MRRRLALIQVLLLLALPGVLNAQVRFTAAGLAGAGFSLSDIGPGAGGGFSYQGAAGIALRRIAFGAEAGEHSLGFDRKVRTFGGFLRFSSLGSGPIQPYFALGVGAYRYSTGLGAATTALGGSLGPGARFRLGHPRLSLVLEARIHTDLDGVARVSTQEFVTTLGGLQIGL